VTPKAPAREEAARKDNEEPDPRTVQTPEAEGRGIGDGIRVKTRAAGNVCKQRLESLRNIPTAPQDSDQNHQKIDPEGLRYDLRQHDFDRPLFPDAHHAEKHAC